MKLTRSAKWCSCTHDDSQLIHAYIDCCNWWTDRNYESAINHNIFTQCCPTSTTSYQAAEYQQIYSLVIAYYDTLKKRVYRWLSVLVYPDTQSKERNTQRRAKKVCPLMAVYSPRWLANVSAETNEACVIFFNTQGTHYRKPYIQLQCRVASST